MSKRPWDQLPDEPDMWFDRFDRFRLMGSSRSLNAIYNEERAKVGDPPLSSVPPSYREYAQKFRWRERATAYDEALRSEAQLMADSKREAARSMRSTTIDALTALFMRLLAEVSKVEKDPKKALTPRDMQHLAYAASLVMKESRLEYGDPTEITDIQSKGESLNAPSVDDLTAVFQQMRKLEAKGLQPDAGEDGLRWSGDERPVD
jgi:hypothetical protein